MEASMLAQRVSVVIPAWNAAATLARALDSVAAQDPRPGEVMVVDDGSTDATAAVAAAHPLSPRVLRQPRNGGESVAMNAGVDAAAGEWIAFLDADDAWAPGKLAAQLPLHVADPGLAFSCTGHREVAPDGRQIDEAGLDPMPHAGADFWRNLLARSVVAKPTVIARRDALVAAGLFDPRLAIAADQDMWLRLAIDGRAAHLPGPWLTVHDTPGSLMRRHARPDLAFTLPMVERALARLGDRLTPAEKRAILGRRWANAARNLAGAGEPALALGAALKAAALGEARLADWRAVAGGLLRPRRALPPHGTSG
jgi:glycosyltransferase involved in cell wall biosynthesis